MNQRATILVAVVLIAAFAMLYVLGGRQTDITGVAAPSGVPGVGAAVPAPSALPMSIVANNDASAPLYRLSIEYPQFPSAPRALNDAIKTFIDTNLNDFKQAIQENWAAREATRPTGTPPTAPSQIYYFDVSWEPAQLNTHYISILLRMAAFVGGANENQQVASFNYDLAKKSMISLSDLFPGKADYLATISQMARTELGDSLKAAGGGYDPTEMLAQGTAPTADNFKNFVFNDNVITIYFPKYQVAPGVFGEQHIGIRRSAL